MKHHSLGERAARPFLSLPFVVRVAARRLWRAPTYTLVVVLTIALGVAANAAVYSLLRGLLVRTPRGVADASSLVQLGRGHDPDALDVVSFPLFDAIRRAGAADLRVAAFASAEALVRTAGAERVEGVTLASGEYFDVLRVAPLRGRLISAADERDATVAVVSEEFWRSALGARGDAIGERLLVNGTPFTIIGVAPSPFRGVDALARRPQLWLPLAALPVTASSEFAQLTSPRYSWLRLVARGRGASRVSQAMVERLVRDVDRMLPGTSSEGLMALDGVAALPRARAVVQEVGLALRALVALLLLVAVANIVVLGGARATARREAVALELTLGSSRARLLAATLAEATLLAGASAIAGGVLLLALRGVVRTLLPADLVADIELDVATAGVIAGAALAATIIASAMPAAMAIRLDAQGALSRSGAASRFGRASRATMVTVQFAGALVLVATATACVKSVRASLSPTPGFSVAGRTTFELRLRAARSPDERRAVWEDLRARVAGIPGVRAVGATATLPLVERQRTLVPLSLEALLRAGGAAPPPITWTAVDEAYFDVLRIPLRRGRSFRATDRGGDGDAPGAAVAIVSEGLARRLFGTEDPIGRRVPVGEDPRTDPVVIGVVADVQATSLAASPTPMLYLHLGARATPAFTAVVDGSAPATIAAVDSLLRGDDRVDVRRTASLATLVGESLRETALLSRVGAVTGALALLMAAVGIFGTMAYAVEQRRHEFGIRLALGATSQRLAAGICGDALRVVASGSVVGIAALSAGRALISRYLYRASLVDADRLGAACAVLAVVAVLAALVPAARAARVSPMSSIRLPRG